MKTSILVIEDDDITMDMMIFLLNSLGYTVIPALNGPAGLAMAKADPPGLIICDIKMPELDGYQVLESLRADPDRRVATIPIIAVTALAMNGDQEQIIAAGFDAYLGKPVEVDALRRAVEQHLA